MEVRHQLSAELLMPELPSQVNPENGLAGKSFFWPNIVGGDLG